MSEWQTIEAAPRDGRNILVAGFDPQPFIEIGYYAPAEENNPGSRENWCDSGRNPTHWMPLPGPPKV